MRRSGQGAWRAAFHYLWSRLYRSLQNIGLDHRVTIKNINLSLLERHVEAEMLKEDLHEELGFKKVTAG